ncbi:MAG: NAD-dependent epimerase/dehydratase family protein [Phycisphaerales bacterium]
MTTTRRMFMKTAASLGVVLAAGAAVARQAEKQAPAAQGKAAGGGKGGKLKILILGGTNFLGPAIVDAAKGRGHTVTLFNRGLTERRKGVAVDAEEKLSGNRDPEKHAVEDDPTSPKGLEQLKGRTFDAVIDTSGFYPRMVKAAAELLGPSVKQYVYISSISAYASNDKPGSDETAPVATMTDPTIESMGASSEYYGPLKALCEQAAEKAMPGRVTNIRPGFIVGPNDGSDRFTYWPVRIERGGEVLVPGTPRDPLQVIDVRDLGAWCVRCCEDGTVGVFNACGPEKELLWGEVIDACLAASPKAKEAKVTWVDAKFLAENGAPPGALPIWLPPEGEVAGFHRWSNKKAVAAGLKCRPIATICKDLVEWWPKEVERRKTAGARMVEDAKKAGKEPPKLPPHDQLRAGIPSSAEKDILEKWHADHK